MPTVVECPSCGQKLKVPEHLLGKKVRCSKCQGAFTASAPESAPPPPPPVEEENPFTTEPSEEEYEERPARRSKRRRDDELETGGGGAPGRGTMLLVFGIISIASAVLTGVCSVIPYANFCAIGIPFLGLTFGILAWVMGSSDLKKIKAGTISSTAKGQTQGGFICGIVGTALNSLILLCGCIGLILFFALGAAFFGIGAAASMQTNIKNPGPVRPRTQLSYNLLPGKLSDYMPRIDGQSR